MFKDKAGNFSPFKLVGLILAVILVVVFISASYVEIGRAHV